MDEMITQYSGYATTNRTSVRIMKQAASKTTSSLQRFIFFFCHCGIFFTHVFVSSYHRLLPESLSDIVLTMISITMFTMVLNRPIAEEYDISLLIRPTL